MPVQCQATRRAFTFILKQMRKLTERELPGFLVRDEDKNKVFYGPEPVKLPVATTGLKIRNISNPGP
jgi:hypothetical protein